MTCIVAVETDKGVWIGADRLGSNGHIGSPVTFPKIFSNGSLTIGYTSSFRMGQLLQYALKVPNLPVNANLDKWVATDLVKAIREAFKDNEWNESKDGVAIGGAFLVVVKNRVYEIQSDFSFLRSISGEYAVGSGQDYALGSLRSTRGQEPEKRLIEALATAAEYVVSVGEPFDVIKVGK
jgi:ATP-dependent protease HslVU (ClpYQ) peptidase subunit